MWAGDQKLRFDLVWPYVKITLLDILALVFHVYHVVHTPLQYSFSASPQVSVHNHKLTSQLFFK